MLLSGGRRPDENAYHVWLRDKDGIEAYARVLPRGAMFPEVPLAA